LRPLLRDCARRAAVDGHDVDLLRLGIFLHIGRLNGESDHPPIGGKRGLADARDPHHGGGVERQLLGRQRRYSAQKDAKTAHDYYLRTTIRKSFGSQAWIFIFSSRTVYDFFRLFGIV
jgi:hypothetical protein